MNSSRSSHLLAVLLSMVLLGVGLPVLGLAASAQAVASATPSPLWTPAARPQARAGGARATVDPSAYKAYTLSASAMDTRLSSTGTTVEVPSPEGKLVEFTVREDSVMQAKLQAAHPDLRSYTGSAVGDPTTSIRMDVGALGFHASVRDGDGLGAWYVDPAYVGDQSLYLSYLGTSLPPREQPAEPELDLSALPSGKAEQARTTAGTAGRPDAAQRAAADPDAGTSVIQRTYRLALVNDPTYAAYFDNGCTASSDACVLSAKQTLVSRLDQIYGTDLAVKMVLINDTDKLNLDTAAKATGHDGACGPAVCYTPSQLSQCSSDTLYRTRTTLGELVGASSYDIGHLALGTSGGGLSFVGAVGTFIKGGGCTGIDPPAGDQYAVDFVAHEMGHQFGANHTFESNSEGSCSGTRNPGTAVEPGSGSSIMAYAGICDRSDLQAHSDPQFSQVSQTQIHDYVSRQFSTDPADGDNETEAQTVSLSNFGSGDSFRLTYAAKTTAPITYAAYSASPAPTVQHALDTILPGGARADVFPYGLASSFTNGFEVDFVSVNLRGRDLPLMSVSVTGGTGSVAETDQGGPVDNQGAAVTTSNHNPNVNAPADKTIPTRTPFTLDGSGTDPDGDPLSYLWEQNDVGGVNGTPLLSQAKKRGPLFRIFGDIAHVSESASGQYDSTGEHLPGTSPSRTFPDLTQVLAGNTNAATGSCPVPPSSGTVSDAIIDCYSEWLPTSAYVGYGANASPPSLHFRLTARDDRDGVGGGTAYADTKLTIDSSTGPFLLTSQPAGSSVSAGASGTVTWQVNGTRSLAPTVRIGLSTDGGDTWQQLASSTTNDGSADVTWPAGVSTQNARIRVSANANYFFAVNDGDFAIGNFPDTTLSGGPGQGSVATSKSATFTPSSSDPDATFQCKIDAAAYTPCASPLRYQGLSSITHHLSVRAVSDGVVDPSPATRTWTVPVGSRGLSITKARWYRKDDPRSFGGSYVQSPGAGATLTRKVTDATGVYLIATKYKPHGSVAVYADGKLLRVIYLDSEQFTPRVRIRAAIFDQPTSATITIENRTNDYVRIEGLGVPTS